MKLQINEDVEAKLEIYNGTSKKTGKDFKALRVTIGKYSTLIFPTPFEMTYLEEQLED